MAGDNTQTTVPAFSTDEILWYNNGKWGEAGYAIPNPAGKTFTLNSVVQDFVDVFGRNLFELMHRPDVRFYAAPQKQFWYDLHQCLIVCRKRLNDQTRTPNDSNGLDVIHAAPDYKPFLVYPIPYFGERVRQTDVRNYSQIALFCLQEAMQQSDNERAAFITPGFSSTIGKYIQEILALMATKYFGYTRAQAYDPAFALKDTDFTNYDPSKVLTSVELTEERPPIYWWPTQNDLSAIRGIPIEDALVLSTPWPQTPRLYSGSAGVGVSTAGSGGNFGAANSSTTPTNDATQQQAGGPATPAASSFVAPPNQAP
jgi:hypothetical protein